MRFFKMNGLGNDYIFIDNRYILSGNTIKKLCDVHTGIGADGVVFYGTDKNCDLSMRIFNRDGSEAEMCGNALRCLVRHHNVLNKTVTVRTKAGIRSGVYNGKEVTINLGKIVSMDTDLTEITVKDQRISGYKINVGNPHFVIFGRYDEELAKEISENTKVFPEKTNVEFVTPTKKGFVTRVYERGCGETMACGTGAAAVFAACGQPSAVILLPGGELINRYNDKNEIQQTGVVKYNFLGEIDNV